MTEKKDLDVKADEAAHRPRTRTKKVDHSKQQADILLFYEANGANLKDACERAGVSVGAHRQWYNADEKYREAFEELRKKMMPQLLNMAEQVGRTVMDYLIEHGVEDTPKHIVNAAISEAQFIRSTIGKDEYSTKVINAVQVDDDGRMTWEDVVKTIQGEEAGHVDKV